MALKPSISCHSFVQSKIVATINSDAYHAHLLTPLSDEAWDSISDDSDRSALENRRMEWVGDGIIAGRITSMLYYMFSKADVEFYHVARDCLVSNSTFKHLMRKICAATAVACPASKISADVFETMVGALYKEHYKNGLEHKFNAWIDDIFMPLTEAAELAFRVYRKINSYKKKKTGPKRVVHKAVLQDIRNQQLLKERRKERARLANISLEQNRLRLLQKYNVAKGPSRSMKFGSSTSVGPESPLWSDYRSFKGDDEDSDEYDSSDENSDGSGSSEEEEEDSETDFSDHYHDSKPTFKTAESAASNPRIFKDPGIKSEVKRR